MRSYLVTTLLCLTGAVNGQSEIWTAVNFEHEVTEHWGYDLGGEYRRNASRASDGSYYLLAAANRTFLQSFSVALAGRYQIPRDDPQEFRLMGDLNYRRDLMGTLALNTRLRLQTDRPVGEDGSGREVAFRQRVALKLGVTDRIDLATEFESRYRFDVRNEWSRLRYTAGIVYAVTPRFEIELFYRIDDDINQGGDERTPIYGLYGVYVLPDGRDRDWTYRRPFGRQILW